MWPGLPRGRLRWNVVGTKQKSRKDSELPPLVIGPRTSTDISHSPYSIDSKEFYYLRGEIVPEEKKEVGDPRRALIKAVIDRKSIASIQEIIKQGINLDYQDIDGSTALHEAIRIRQQETAKFLIRSGVNVNIQDNNGSTPLMDAIYEQQDEVVDLLLSKGARLDITNKQGKNCFSFASPPQITKLFEEQRRREAEVQKDQKDQAESSLPRLKKS